jgi:hypothetical protein
MCCQSPTTPASGASATIPSPGAGAQPGAGAIPRPRKRTQEADPRADVSHATGLMSRRLWCEVNGSVLSRRRRLVRPRRGGTRSAPGGRRARRRRTRRRPCRVGAWIPTKLTQKLPLMLLFVAPSGPAPPCRDGDRCPCPSHHPGLRARSCPRDGTCPVRARARARGHGPRDPQDRGDDGDDGACLGPGPGPGPRLLPLRHSRPLHIRRTRLLGHARQAACDGLRRTLQPAPHRPLGHRRWVAPVHSPVPWGASAGQRQARLPGSVPPPLWPPSPLPPPP